MTTPAHRRLLRDFKKVTADSPEGLSAAPVGDDLFNWTAIILGPVGTPWECGVWKLEMSFPPEYPDKPPEVRFRSEVFHPNVHPDGKVCLDLLRAPSWTPTHDVGAVLLAVQALLANPATGAQPSGGANPQAESLFLKDRPQYNARVKELVGKQLDDDDADMGCLSAVP